MSLNDNNTIGIKNMIFSILTSSNSARDKFILIVAYALAAMFAIVIHEYSHARVAVKCGDLTPKLAGRLTLNPMAHFDVFGLVLFFLIGFGWAKPVPINPDNFGHKKRDTIFTSLAGIFANLLTAAVFLGVLCLINLIPEDAVYASVFGEVLYFLVAYFLMYGIILSCSLMLFNILPVFPLDGFRVVETLAGPTNKYVKFMYRYGSWPLIVVLIAISFIPDKYNMFSLFLNAVYNLIFKVLGSF